MTDGGRFYRGSATAKSAIGALRPPSGTKDDHGVIGVDDEDDPKVADSEPPEVGARKLCRTGRAGVNAGRQDRPSKPRRLSRWQPTELALRGGREDDPSLTLAQRALRP
jgi:hypothetical protein